MMPRLEERNCDSTSELVADIVGSSFGCADRELHVGGIGIRRLADKYGTPLYLYDQRIQARQWQQLRDTLPDGFHIYYSVKANPNQAILRFFVEQGCGLEIASIGELRQALAAGCRPERILFAGPGKSDSELAAALDFGIAEVHVESLSEAVRLAALARDRERPAPIALRVNPGGDVEGGGMRMGGRPTPFGIDEDQLDAVLREIRDEKWLDIRGVHLFVGTQILDAEILLTQYRTAIAIAGRVAQSLGKPCRTIDFGGGLGVPYFAHERPLDLKRLGVGLSNLVSDIIRDDALSDAQLIVEPGRFLVAPSGIYVARVVDVKTSRGRKFVITDGGMHHHLAASGNLGQTIKRNFPVAVLNKLDQRAATEPVDIVGPLCTPLDVLARNVSLPPIEIGDLIGVFQSGAYARTASPLGFLSRPAPPEVFIARGEDRLVRRRGEDGDHLSDQLPAPSATA